MFKLRRDVRKISYNKKNVERLKKIPLDNFFLKIFMRM